MSCVCFAQAAAQPQIWRGAFFPSTTTINMVWHFEDQYEIQYSTVRWCKNDRGQGRQRLNHGPWAIHGWIMRGRQAWLIKSYPTTWHPWRPDICGEVNLKNQEMQLGNPVFFRWTGDSQKFICVFQVGETCGMTDDDSVCCDAIFQRSVEGLEDDEEFCLVKRILGKAVWCRLAEFCLTFCGFCMDEILLSLAVRPETTCGELQMTAMRRRAIPSFSPWSAWKLENQFSF